MNPKMKFTVNHFRWPFAFSSPHRLLIIISSLFLLTVNIFRLIHFSCCFEEFLCFVNRNLESQFKTSKTDRSNSTRILLHRLLANVEVNRIETLTLGDFSFSQRQLCMADLYGRWMIWLLRCVCVCTRVQRCVSPE